MIPITVIVLVKLLALLSVGLSQDVGVVVETGNMTIMRNLYNSQGVTDLKAQLKQQKLTLFHPTDDAFAKIPDGWLQLIKRDVLVLRKFLQLHMLSGSIIRSRDVDITGGSRVLIHASDEGTRLDLSLLNGKVQITTSSQSVPAFSKSLDGTPTNNGVIYYTNAVLFSQTLNLPNTNVRVNMNIPRTYATALSLSGMGDRVVAGEFKDLTILAPSDAAFAFRDITPESLSSWPKEHIQRFIRYTFLNQFYSQSSLQTGNAVLQTRLLNSAVTLEGGQVKGEKQGFAAATILYNTTTTEGVVYAIDSLLLPLNFEIPQSSVLDVGRLPPLFGAAVSYSGMRSAVLAKNITFFSPTDEAFSAAGIRTAADFNEHGPDTMKRIVQFCMVKGYYDMERLRASTTPLRTYDNETIVVDNRGTSLFIHSSRQMSELVEVRIATDGIVHVTNTLLLPVGVDLDNSNSNSLTTLDVILVSSLAAVCCIGGLFVLHKGSITTYLQDRQKELAEQEARVGKELLKDQEVKVALGRDYNGFRALGDEYEQKEVPEPPEIIEPPESAQHLNQRALENIDSVSRSSFDIPSNNSSSNNFVINSSFQFPKRKSGDSTANNAPATVPRQRDSISGNGNGNVAVMAKSGDGKTGDGGLRPPLHGSDNGGSGVGGSFTRSRTSSNPVREHPLVPQQGRGRRVQLPPNSTDMW